MARKKKHEEHVNHERWLVSYADFITLLFAFFVVLYSVSSVNEGKYRVLSDSMLASFRSPTKSLMPIQVGSVSKVPSSRAVELPPMVANRIIDRKAKSPQPAGAAGAGLTGQTPQEALHKVANDLARAFEPLIAQDLVTVREGQLWVEVEIRAAVLFASGSAAIMPQALPVVDQVVGILGAVPNSVRVEGYTDNVPINTGQYRSNWDLSAARAGSMVHHLLAEGLDPLRLSLAGYGEYRPIDDNTTEAGRNRNRRVVLVVLATPDAAAQRDLQTSLAAPPAPPPDGLRLPGGVPSPLSLLQAQPDAPLAPAPAPAVTATLSAPATVDLAPPPSARWPADRRAAGQVPDFVPAPGRPPIAPAL